MKNSRILATISLAIFSMISVATLASDRPAHQSLVSEDASIFTPSVLDGRVEAIAIQDNIVYVGGTFTQIETALGGQVFNQPHLFAYDNTTGAIIESFRPVIDNTVRALQTTADGNGIFVGGNFVFVNGERRRGIVKLRENGTRDTSFQLTINKRVYTLDRNGNTLYIGGNFDEVNQSPREFLAAINATNGNLRNDIDLNFSGVLSTNNTTGFPSVDIIEVTSDDDLMVVVGNFTAVDGFSRSRLALIELGNNSQVSSWNTNVFDIQCPSSRFPQYINGIDIAPDDSYFITGTTGAGLIGNPACDSILRFDLDNLNNNNAQPAWINYTGGDSVYEVASTEHAIYVGGHFRWLNNGFGRDFTSSGFIERRGLAALDPLNGLPLVGWRSDRNPRGVGVFALEVTDEGLYIGDDTDFLNGSEHPKLKFLPLTSERIIREEAPTLPASLVRTNNNTFNIANFNGHDIGAIAGVNANFDLSNIRGGFFVGNTLFYTQHSNFLMTTINGNNQIASPTQIDLRGIFSNRWNLQRISGMFFDYDRARIYYTLENDSRLFWRAFSPENPIVGDFENVENINSDIDWASVRGMDIVDGHLYYGNTSGRLYRVRVNGVIPINGTKIEITGANVLNINWNMPFLAFDSGQSNGGGSTSSPIIEFSAAGSAGNNSFRRFNFDLGANQEVTVNLEWVDTDADLTIFVRDPNDNLVASDGSTVTNGRKLVAFTSTTSGTYTVAVNVRSGATLYTVEIDPTNSTIILRGAGDSISNRFRAFDIDVEAGDTVDVMVSWSDASDNLRLFLRDETNTQVARDTEDDGILSRRVSVVAGSSGEWSIGVSVVEGSTDYDIFVTVVE